MFDFIDATEGLDIMNYDGVTKCKRCGEYPWLVLTRVLCRCGEQTKSYASTMGEHQREKRAATDDWNKGILLPYVRPLEKLLSEYNRRIDMIVEDACERLEWIKPKEKAEELEIELRKSSNEYQYMLRAQQAAMQNSGPNLLGGVYNQCAAGYNPHAYGSLAYQIFEQTRSP